MRHWHAVRAFGLILAIFLLLGVAPAPPDCGKMRQLGERMNAFAFDFLGKYAAQANGNFIVSPESFFLGLAPSYLGARGDTRSEIGQVFHYPETDDELLTRVGELRESMTHGAGEGIDVNIADSLWTDTTYATFRKDFLDNCKKRLGAEIHEAPLVKNKPRACKSINDWVSKQTHGHITDVILPDDLPSRSIPLLGKIEEAALVVVDAVYFKGDWASRFKEEDGLTDRTFHLDADKTILVPLMHQKEKFHYAEDEEYKFLRMPYHNETYSMYAVMPKEIKRLPELAAALTAARLATLRSAAFEHLVDIEFPKYEIRTTLNAAESNGPGNGILQQLGMKKAFTGEADFLKMIVPKLLARQAYISSVSQEAWIKTDEKGSEAAAATKTVHYSMSCSKYPVREPLYVEFHVDRPFLYMIVHEPSQSIVFLGGIADPRAGN